MVRRKAKRRTAKRRPVRRARKAKRRTAKKRRGPAFGGLKIKPDANLGKVIGKGAMSPAQMTKKVWAYIKKKKLARK